MLEIQMQLKGKEMLMLAEKIEQFLDVSEKVLSKTRYIAANVWKNGGDIRDVISIEKLVRKSEGPQEIQMIMNTIKI